MISKNKLGTVQKQSFRAVLYVKKLFLEISQNSQENTCATLLKKKLWHRCFPVNFVKFLRTPFSQKSSGWLFLISLGIAIGTVFSKILCSSRSSRPEVFDEKRVRNNFTGKYLCRSLFFTKLQAEDTKIYSKETSAQVFSCVYLETPDLNWLIFCCCWLIFFWCCCW